MATAKGTLSYLGAKVYMSATGVTPVAADILNSWESCTGLDIKVTTVTNNRVDGDGYERKTGTIKGLSDITMKFWKDDSATYTKLKSQVVDTETSASTFYVDFTFIPPTNSDFASVSAYTQTGQVTGFKEGDMNTTDAQSYTITFTPSGKPTTFTGTITA